MREGRQLPWLIVVSTLSLLPIGAAAQLTTEQGASIIVFPKVIADGTWDTVIQIANQSKNSRLARCFYVNGVSAPRNTQGRDQIDFEIFLSKLQPTHWVVSRGRFDDPTDARCSQNNRDCDTAGFDPGRVPPPPPDFRGELLCVETDAGGFPVPGNALVGKATLEHLPSGSIATYNAIGLKGLDSDNVDLTLCLGGNSSAACPNGGEYTSCPRTWILNHPADGAEDAFAGSGSSVTTSIAVVPCTQNLQVQIPQAVTLQFLIFNELEERFSASTTITGWADLALVSIDSPDATERSAFHRATLGTDYAQTRINVVNVDPSRGILVVAHTFRRSGGAKPLLTAPAVNVHSEAVSGGADVITLPASQ